MKLFLLLSVIMLATALATLWIWRRSPSEVPCDSRDIAQKPSPDTRMQADIFELRCGDSVTTHVAVRPTASGAGARSDVFVAAGNVPVRVLWTGDRELDVESSSTRVLVEEARWRDVSVRVRRAP